MKARKITKCIASCSPAACQQRFSSFLIFPRSLQTKGGPFGPPFVSCYLLFVTALVNLPDMYFPQSPLAAM
jgi:hypothetical protein